MRRLLRGTLSLLLFIARFIYISAVIYALFYRTFLKKQKQSCIQPFFNHVTEVTADIISWKIQQSRPRMAQCLKNDWEYRAVNTPLLSSYTAYVLREDYIKSSWGLNWQIKAGWARDRKMGTDLQRGASRADTLEGSVLSIHIVLHLLPLLSRLRSPPFNLLLHLPLLLLGKTHVFRVAAVFTHSFTLLSLWFFIL